MIASDHPPNVLAPLAYLIAYCWALAVSAKRWKTLMWMVISLLSAWVALAIAAYVLEAVTKNENSDLFIVEMFFIPSFIVPAIVGVIHARRHRRQLPPNANADSG
jgi:biotin transporter BioY